MIPIYLLSHNEENKFLNILCLALKMTYLKMRKNQLILAIEKMNSKMLMKY